MLPWNDVPLSAVAAWRRLFDVSEEGIDLSAPCPLCGEKALHRWFWLSRPGLTVESNRTWQGKGSQWQWCSACHSYEHSSGLVPEWWRPSLVVADADLKHDPGPIEDARLRGR